MASKNSLTIAIPTYNRAEKSSKLAQSVLKQLEADDELLVVNDGSSDNTSELLGAIPGVRVHNHNPNQGMVKTWNACLQLASKEWICIIHDDDILCDGGLQAVRAACSTISEPALILHRAISNTETNQLIYQIFSPGPTAVYRSATGTVPSGVAVHRDIVTALGKFDEDFAYSSDIEFFARISAQYKVFVIESPAVVEYQLHDDNYQYKTWLKPDFFPQLLEIERRVAAYSGLKGTVATYQINSRMLSYLGYIIQHSTQLKNKTLMRKYGSILWESPAYRRRARLSGLVTNLKGRLPL